MLARSNPTLFEQHLEKLELFHRLHNKYSKDMALLVGLLQETPEWARVRDFLPDEDEYQERLNLVSRYGPSMTRFEFVALMFVLPIEVLETYLSRPSLHTDLEGKLRSLKQLVQKCEGPYYPRERRGNSI